jgi:hypothetical protein
MHNSRKLQVALLLLIACSAASVTAQTSGAMLYVTGQATLNGVQVNSASSIFAGDRVVTSNSSIVSVNRPGFSVVVNPNSTIQYGKSSIEVIQGSARITAASGMSAQAGQVVVASKDQSASFDVTRAADQVTVVSRQGVLLVDDGGRTVTVPAGSNATLHVAAASTESVSASAKPQAASGLLAGGPFYSIYNAPSDLPICSDFDLCIRPRVSQIRPCRCKP